VVKSIPNKIGWQQPFTRLLRVGGKAKGDDIIIDEFIKKPCLAMGKQG